MGDDKITFKLTGLGYARRQCHICGYYSDETPVAAQADSGMIVCENCLESRGFDDRLRSHAQRVEAMAATIRSMIGRIEAPTFAEWRKACRDWEVANKKEIAERCDAIMQEIKEGRANRTPLEKAKAWLARRLADADEIPF